MRRSLSAPSDVADNAAAGREGPAKVATRSVRRNDILLSAVLYVVAVAATAGFAYDLFGKAFGLVHNRCAAKRDFTVQCEAIKPAASALWGLLIGGGGMALALMSALVIASVAAMTGRRAWVWPALAIPVVLICGGVGHLLIGNAAS